VPEGLDGAARPIDRRIPAVRAQHECGASVTYTVVLVRDEDGGYCVHMPALKGCHTEGDNLPEALRMAGEAIECHLDSLHEHGEAIREDVQTCCVEVRDVREALIYKVRVQTPVPTPAS
jgi:predicted RNase H-like HicB family nuclease